MHTPGTLKVIDADEYCGTYITDQFGETVADLYFMTRPNAPHRFTNSADNARRLVACWNACEGIDTEKLEGMRLDAAPALLEALVAALHDLETSAGLMACDNEEGHSLFQLTHHSTKQVIAAIAAARGEEVTA